MKVFSGMAQFLAYVWQRRHAVDFAPCKYQAGLLDCLRGTHISEDPGPRGTHISEDPGPGGTHISEDPGPSSGGTHISDDPGPRGAHVSEDPGPRGPI